MTDLESEPETIESLRAENARLLKRLASAGQRSINARSILEEKRALKRIRRALEALGGLI